jgi:hypothetical protein
MKTIYLFMLASGLVLASCQKSPVDQNLTPTEDAVRRGRGADDPVVPPPSNLPAIVLNAFTASHPTATRMEWQAEDNNTWKVKYFIGTIRWRALFAADGTLIWDRLD